MNNWLLFPPIAFIIILIFSFFSSFILKKLSFKSTSETKGKNKAYACGEDVPCHRIQPDYSQFFPFAFFFTIMHVVALIIATAPYDTLKISGIAILYLLAAFCSLFILFRKQS